MNAPSADLRLGDCLEQMHLLRDACVDLVIADPPYGTTNLDFDRRRARFDPLWWAAWWREVHRVTTERAVVAVFAAQPFATDLITSNRPHFRYDLIWQKTRAVGFLSANIRPLRAHEAILIFCRRPGRMSRPAGEPGCVYNPQFVAGAPYAYRHRARPATHYSALKDLGTGRSEARRHPTSVLTFGPDPKSYHPTQKPLGLLRWLVRTYSHPGQRVLDPFLGGGNGAIAALLEAREAVGIEMDPGRLATAHSRVSGLAGVRML